jgi:hypothetical protein
MRRPFGDPHPDSRRGGCPPTIDQAPAALMRSVDVIDGAVASGFLLFADSSTGA